MADDVSLKEYVDTRLSSSLRLGAVVAAAVLAVIVTLNTGTAKALTIALEEAKEKGRLHNDLIRKGERDAANYITRGQVYSALGTGLVVLGLVIAYYANFGT